jgi:hypothetical protein
MSCLHHLGIRWMLIGGASGAVLCLSNGVLAQAAFPPETAPGATEPPAEEAPPAPAPPTAQPAPAPPPYAYPYPPPPGYEAAPAGAYPPYGYPYPPAYTTPPATLHYVEGQPIPEGYHVERGPIRALVVAGAATTGSVWILGLSFASGSSFANASGWLLVPVLGPWIALGTRRNECRLGTNSTDVFCDSSESSMRTLYVLDGLVQGAGAAMFLAGMLSTRTKLVRNDVAEITVAPILIGSGHGLGAFGRF